MIAHAAGTTWGVRVAGWLVGLLLVGGLGLLTVLAHWPGLLKLVPILAVTFGWLGREMWRSDEPVHRSSHVAGPAALVGAVFLAVFWPVALPAERLATVAAVLVLAAGWSVLVELAVRRQR